ENDMHMDEKHCKPQRSMIDTGIVSPGVNPSRIGRYQLDKVSTSSITNPVISTDRNFYQGIQSGNTLEDANISGIATESNSINNVFGSIRAAGAELNQVPSAATKTTHSSSDLLGDIRAGINLKQTQSSSLQPADLETNDFLSEIQTGVKLKQVDRSTLQPADLETNGFLSEIQTGVKLKQVDRSTLLPPKQKKTPMSALLAKIQERKQACMRRERESVSVSIEQSEIDW
ncbi:MAG: hypothetical protein ACI90V_010383, partial [Bacillariaceae sp.]